jgi:hypothetical protein
MHAPTDEARPYWQKLLHRWLVEYNPLYLLSATLVLGGMILTSRGLAEQGSLHGQLGVAAIAELYALALIGGAALLVRIGQRRPAVMLALITALYQCDLTLHTETCVYLGAAGVVASVAWVALFVAKLHALARAVRVRLSRGAFATATLGALGLAALPYAAGGMDPRGASALVAVWVFALASAHRAAEVSPLVPLDRWGATVLRRAVRATWLLWGLLLGLHVYFWSTQHALELRALAPVVPLVLSRRVRSEARAWMVVAATLVGVALVSPPLFSVTALVGAGALALRAARGGALRTARLRLVTGALVALYLSAWTAGWTSGAWPDHVVALDVALAVGLAFLFVRGRVRVALAPLGATGVHFVVRADLVPAPRGPVEWGGAAMALGFAALIVALATSYRLRDRSSA